MEGVMMHALAIGRAGPDAVTAINGLWDAGYRSIVRVDEIGEAPAMTACFRPDLILVLPDAGRPGSVALLRGIARKANAPVVVARTDVKHALDCLGPVAVSGTRRMPPRQASYAQLAA